MVTQKDIAREAGVSVMTVSRVINGRYGKVSKKNIEKIEEIIKRNGYVPNLSARGLSSKNSGIIVIIIRGEGNRLMDPYNATMIGYISVYLQEKGYSTMIYTENNYQDIVKRLRTWNAEGAIFFGMFDDEVQIIQDENEMPLIFNDSYSRLRQITNIGIDDYKGGELAARHLFENGHRNVGFLGHSTDVNGVDRQRMLGYTKALESMGIPLDPKHLYNKENGEWPSPEAFRGKNPLTALFVTADLVAMELMSRLRASGIAIPEECSLIGFDDLPVSEHLMPRLTSIRQDLDEKAHYSVVTLLNHLRTPKHPAEKIVLDVKLIKRDSVAVKTK